MHSRLPLSRKGQLSLFIIVAIVIIVFVITLRMQPPATPLVESTVTEADVREFKEFLNACFQESARESLLFLETRGTLDLLGPHVLFGDHEVGVLVQGSTSLIPPKDVLETQLAQEVLSSYGACENDDEDLFPFEIERSFETATATASILPTKVVVSVNVPTWITIGSHQVSGLGTHAIEIPSNLFALHQDAVRLGQALASQPGFIPLNELSESRFPTYTHPLTDNLLILRLLDEDAATSLDESPQSYAFGVSW